MIELITGLPGNGKTLYALQRVRERAEREGRPVFYARVSGLTLPWTLIDPYDWMSAPAGAIIVIDECQQSADPSDPKAPTLFGVRPRGAPVPPWAAALETHRHKGVDLVLITQDPMLLDAHDRKLVQTHWHVVRTFGLQRATVHEFNGARPNVAQSRSGSIRHEWRYPREAYGWYRSAELHTAKARVPMRIWLLLALPFIIGGIAWVAWAKFLDPHRSDKAAPAAAAQGPMASASAAPAAQREVRLSKAEYLEQFVPRVAGLAYTAPVYDEATKPVQAPYPAACIANDKRCQCYTQQGTRLELPADLCRSVAEGGFFVAWERADTRAQQSRPYGPGAPTAAPAGAGSFGGNPRAHILGEARR